VPQEACSEEATKQRPATLSLDRGRSLPATLKLGVGLLTGSLALVSAGIESSCNVPGAILTFSAMRLGRQPADPEHAHGHGVPRTRNLAEAPPAWRPLPFADRFVQRPDPDEPCATRASRLAHWGDAADDRISA
jgi:hypothetical protein